MVRTGKRVTLPTRHLRRPALALIALGAWLLFGSAALASGLDREQKDKLSQAYVQAVNLALAGEHREAHNVLTALIDGEWSSIIALADEMNEDLVVRDELDPDFADQVFEHNYYVSSILGLKCQLEIVLVDSPLTHNQAWCRDKLSYLIFGDYANLVALAHITDDSDEVRDIYGAALDARSAVFDPLVRGAGDSSIRDIFDQIEARTRGDLMMSGWWVSGVKEGWFAIEGYHLGNYRYAYNDASNMACLALLDQLRAALNLRRHPDKFYLFEGGFRKAQACQSPYWRSDYTEQFQAGLLMEAILRTDALNDGAGIVGFEMLEDVLPTLRLHNDVTKPLFEMNDPACSELAPVTGGGGVRLDHFWQDGFLADVERDCLQANLESESECEKFDSFACYLRSFAVWPGVGVP